MFKSVFLLLVKLFLFFINSFALGSSVKIYFTDEKVFFWFCILSLHPFRNNLSIIIYQCIHLSIYLSIHLSFYISIYRSIYLSLYLSIYWWINLFNYLWIYLYIFLLSCLMSRRIKKKWYILFRILHMNHRLRYEWFAIFFCLSLDQKHTILLSTRTKVVYKT